MKISERKESPIIGLTGIGGGPSSYIFYSASGGDTYEISKSLRLDDTDTGSYLNKTFSTGGTTGTTTFATWVKRFKLDTQQSIISVTESSNYAAIQFNDTNQLVMNPYNTNYGVATGTSKLVDTAAWYHIAVVFDTSNSTDADKLRLYVNGIRETVTNYTAPSAGIFCSSNNEHRIGMSNGTSHPLGAYLADVHMLDGTAISNNIDTSYNQSK